MLTWRDFIAAVVIFVVSYWIAFKSGVSKFIVNYLDKKKNKKKVARGDITGKTGSPSKNETFIKKSDLLLIYRGESEESNRLAKEFMGESGLTCELIEADNYDFTVLEVLRIPVVFILDRSEALQEFLMHKEKDPKDIRAYKRRYLSNLRYSVVEAGDRAFAQFVDETLCQLGAKRVHDLISSGELKTFSHKFG